MSEPTTPDELRAVTRLAFDELGGAVGGIGNVHKAIAGRVFGAVGPAAQAVSAIHDGVARASYAAVRGGFGLAGSAAEAALGRRPPGAPLSTSPRGGLLLAALQGLRGDALEAEGSPLAQPMAVRVAGRPVPPEADALARAFPDATGRVVVFVHGLMETEGSWRLGSPDGETYGSRLRRDLGCTPVDIRYNTGRHISQNGRSLADLLEQLVAAWPVEVEEVALIGHSMGGLVARSACHLGALESQAWTARVRHVVSLGTPHLGAPLEQGVHVLSAALSAVPETRPLGSFFRRRSAGIRDLRQGSLVDADWDGRDPDALRAAACEEVPLLEGATHCFVSATVTRSARHPVGRLIGDWLVLQPSATGRGRTRRIPFDAEFGLHVGGATHFALLNHPKVYASLRRWLAGEPPHVEGRELRPGGGEAGPRR
jgi:pimeloyl-ACP methyl ester carboxylesterase